MVMLPLPFLTAFCLCFLLAHLALSSKRRLPPLSLLVIGAYALQSGLIGLNWGVGGLPPMILPSLAVALPPLTWLSLDELSGRIDRKIRLLIFSVIAVCTGTVSFGMRLNYPNLADTIGIAVYLAFGFDSLWRAYRSKGEWNEDRPLHLIIPMQRAYLMTGIILLTSASVDVVVAIDVEMNGARISSALVGYANLVLLLVLLYIFFYENRRKKPEPSAMVDPPKVPSASLINPAYKEILEKLEREMNDSQLYRNENLSLSRIANKIRVPVRQISTAVNSVYALNVPQYVNNFRVRDACKMLEETDDSVIDIAFAVGFTTKSNFNREFLRVTGVSPSVWRSRVRGTETGLAFLLPNSSEAKGT
ncbi:helix-turn-helix domain-containing protein [Azospirillum sp. A23]|uniref:helix-turn-helix domain-containing protein n=1 Tax=Azospirillum sp. A23 TaxID=3160608 RepID=UPI0036F1DF25